MNPQIISREEILSQSRILVMKKGIPAVNMRSVAAACGVALGSLYNYFPSKSALILATVEKVWDDIFFTPEPPPSFCDFLPAVQWMFDSLHRGSITYPGFLTLHAMSFADQDKQSGRHIMEKCFSLIKESLFSALEQDTQVKTEVFDEHFTKQGLINLVFNAVIATTLQNGEEISVLIGLLRHALY